MKKVPFTKKKNKLEILDCIYKNSVIFEGGSNKIHQ